MRLIIQKFLVDIYQLIQWLNIHRNKKKLMHNHNISLLIYTVFNELPNLNSYYINQQNIFTWHIIIHIQIRKKIQTCEIILV